MMMDYSKHKASYCNIKSLPLLRHRSGPMWSRRRLKEIFVFNSDTITLSHLTAAICNLINYKERVISYGGIVLTFYAR